MKKRMLKRINFSTWQQFESHWVDGLVERISLVKRPFVNPILVHPKFLPFPKSQLVDPLLTHRLASLETLTISKNTHDLILFSPFLQWTKDVPGMLKQAYNSLTEGGLFVACFFGQDTLIEFKSVCAAYDIEHAQGLQQRFLPTIHTKDAGMLMQRAGFAGPTADIEHLSFSVTSVESLVEKLRDSGMNNSMAKVSCMPYIPTTMLQKTFLSAANHSYLTQYPHQSGGLNVSVDLIFICGWKQSDLKSISLLNKNPPIAL